ncbi:D-amino-acid oxidase isoform X1 [Pararge aegeria]|uniref:D-amino-acid oxidase isoform X1 n=1 Tax=Pararge aegeria TaxID=116150 RepID=UPI0019D0293B|nr:D-amino-acid oxidase isoform X1 [Pararge aegeria]
MTKVAVLGAGINGLACAVRVKEKYPNIHVVIIASEFTPNTTGDGSGGFWYPYLCGITSQDLLCKWGSETYKYLYGLWREGGHDLCLLPMFELYREKRELVTHSWAKDVLGYRILDEKQLSYLSGLYSVKYVSGRTFTSFIAYPPTILAHLHRRFEAANGQTLQYRINSLDDKKLDDYDVVINCLGLGAREVVPDDKVVPIRGQISRVIAPWVTNAVMDEDSGNYILPNVHNCVLGGTHQTNDFNRSIVGEDTDFVLNGCSQLIPGLKNAELITQWAGLRPGRESVRLEAEQRDGKLYIHNYGHGGSGLTLFWGCAADVLEIFDKHLTEGRKQNAKL